jgi:hypothetical protein
VPGLRIQEKLRVNVWSEGLKFRLRVGPWLSDAKRAVRRGAPDDVEIVIRPDQVPDRAMEAWYHPSMA